MSYGHYPYKYAQPPHEDSTEPFACGLGIQDNTYGDWAEKVEEGVDYTVQGEYIFANYSPTTDPPSSASSGTLPHPPHRRTSPPGPTTSHLTVDTDPPTPTTRPNAPMSAPSARDTSPSKTNDHVISMCRMQHRTPSGSRGAEPPRYIPPVLYNHGETSYRPQQHVPQGVIREQSADVYGLVRLVCQLGGVRAASLFILCILHVNTSLFLLFSRSIAEYGGDTMSPQKNHIIHISVLGCSVQTITDLHRAGQILRGAVQSCTARHPSVTSVVLWTTVQLCPDCTDWPGFADALQIPEATPGQY